MEVRQSLDVGRDVGDLSSDTEEKQIFRQRASLFYSLILFLIILFAHFAEVRAPR